LESYPLNKIAPPRINRVIPRRRLFDLLVQYDHQPTAVWIAGPAGSGKTSLMAGYLAAQELRAIWYQVDAGDAEAMVDQAGQHPGGFGCRADGANDLGPG
jgi:ATP/maltotriose-dependent transcriptional regulator MalT